MVEGEDDVRLVTGTDCQDGIPGGGRPSRPQAVEAGQGAGAQHQTPLCVSGPRTLGTRARLLRGLMGRVSRVLTPALSGWLFPFGRKLRRNRAGRRIRASLIPDTTIIFFPQDIILFQPPVGTTLANRLLSCGRNLGGGLSFSVDPSDHLCEKCPHVSPTQHSTAFLMLSLLQFMSL